MIDLRSPYTAEEHAAIVAALKAERERRAKRNLAFPWPDQSAVIDAVLRPMREPPGGSPGPAVAGLS